RGAPVYQCVPPDVISPDIFSETDLSDARRHVALAGSHQELNALVALAALLVSNALGSNKRTVSEIVSEGFEKVYWPGRMQYLDGMNLILDGAHNPAGARALRTALEELFPARKFLFLVGCFQNKDVPTYIRELIRPGDRVIASEASARRAVFPAD